MPRKQFNVHKYINGLTQIDTAFCPKKFEQAWLDYIQATTRASDQNPIRGEFVMGMIGVATKSPSLEPTTAKPPEAKDEVERAWQNIERIALEYNVRIIHQS